MERYSVTEEDMKRFYILKKVAEKQMSTKDASLVLSFPLQANFKIKEAVYC